MPKIVTSLMRAQIALLNPLLNRLDVKAQRKLQDALGELGVKIMTDSVAYRDEPFDSFQACWAWTKDAPNDRGILYLHGGAYTAGSLAYARCFGGVLAEKTGLRVLCVGYRLAPESPYPAALEDALCAYRRLLLTCAPENIALAGESAGGGLCYCLCLRLLRDGLPLPGKVVALSPWADLTMEGDYGDLAQRDPVLNRQNLRYSAELYADGHLTEPMVSPLYGNLTGLPPSLIEAGTDELLLRDAKGLQQRMLECGCSCKLNVTEGMWHVYVLYGIPEAKAALERIRAFILEK